MKEIRNCIDCGRSLRDKNPNEDCYRCREEKTYRKKYEKLKKELEGKEELWRILSLDYYNKLKKYEPDIIWDEEPE